MAGFPENILDELEQSFTEFMPPVILVAADPTATPPVVEESESIPIARRPLRFTDPERSVGLHAVDWSPLDDSAQIGQMEPGISRYMLRIQNLVKHTDEEEGRALYVADAKMVRAILYRDAGLRVRLGELNETILDTIERFKRMGVRTQRFLNNELSGQFVFLATTELWVETEITQL